MKSRIIEFLSKYADGRFVNSAVYETPEVTFLAIDENLPSTESEMRALEASLESELGMQIIVTALSQQTIQSVTTSIVALVKSKTGVELKELNLRLQTKGKASLTVSLPGAAARGSQIEEEVRNIAAHVCESVGFELTNVDVNGEVPKVFTLARLLKVIVIHAPINLQDIERILKEEGTFQDSDTKLLKSRLDKLREDKKIFWQKENGSYVPTRQALYDFSNRRSRVSSDVERALELGRRQW